MMDIPVKFVPTRNVAHTDDDLGIRCDATERPRTWPPPNPTELRDVIHAGKDESEWVALANFHGKVTQEETAAVVEAASPDICPVAIAIAKERVLGILAPENDDEPALWWAWHASEIRVETSGSQGMFRKRPETIELSAYEGRLLLSQVSRDFRHAERLHAGKAHIFLKKLARAQQLANAA